MKCGLDTAVWSPGCKEAWLYPGWQGTEHWAIVISIGKGEWGLGTNSRHRELGCGRDPRVVLYKVTKGPFIHLFFRLILKRSRVR